MKLPSCAADRWAAWLEDHKALWLSHGQNNLMNKSQSHWHVLTIQRTLKFRKLHFTLSQQSQTYISSERTPQISELIIFVKIDGTWSTKLIPFIFKILITSIFFACHWENVFCSQRQLNIFDCEGAKARLDAFLLFFVFRFKPLDFGQKSQTFFAWKTSSY